MLIFRTLIAAFLLAAVAAAQENVTFPTPDGWTIHADLYGTGERGVVLVPGAKFVKGSWEKQARVLEKAGFRVLAIDLRGFGASKEGPAGARTEGGFAMDVLAAVRYLHEQGARTVAVVGASMGGNATEAALVKSKPGEIDRVVLLAHGAFAPAKELKGRKLFIVSREDPGPGGQPRLVRIRAQYEEAPEPKELVVLEGSAHAQYIFATDQGERLMREILRFLSEA